MATLKTQPTDTDVPSYLAGLDNPRRQAEAPLLLDMMKRVTGEDPVMWGPSIIGYGRYNYKYKTGWSGSCFITGFAPRKAALTIHIMAGFDGLEHLLTKLGKHRTAKSCLYINKLEDIDIAVLEELVAASVATMRRRYPDDGS